MPRSSNRESAADTGDRNDKCAFLLRYEREKEEKTFCSPSFIPPKPYQAARFFPRGTDWSPGLTRVVSSLQPKPIAPFTDSPAAEKSKRARSGCAALSTNNSFSPLCGSTAQRTTHLAFSALTVPYPPPGRAQAREGGSQSIIIHQHQG